MNISKKRRQWSQCELWEQLPAKALNTDFTTAGKAVSTAFLLLVNVWLLHLKMVCFFFFFNSLARFRSLKNKFADAILLKVFKPAAASNPKRGKGKKSHAPPSQADEPDCVRGDDFPLSSELISCFTNCISEI